jgi:hypothetical protein
LRHLQLELVTGAEIAIREIADSGQARSRSGSTVFRFEMPAF